MIDFHVHIGRVNHEFTAEFASEMIEACDRQDGDLTVDETSLLEEMNKSDVEKAVLLAFNAQRSLGVVVPNELVGQYCRRYPDRFIGLGSFDPRDSWTESTLRKELENNYLNGYKLTYGYLGLSPNDPLWEPLYKDALTYNRPILVHMGYTPIKRVQLRYCQPMLLDDVLRKYNQMKLIVAHLGWPWVDETFALLQRYEHVYADISIVHYYQGIDAIVAILLQAVRLQVINKLIWGTDYPMCTMTDSLARISVLKAHPALYEAISEEQWNAMMFRTAQRVLQI